MSIPVPLDDLVTTMSRYPFTYLLTVGDERPRVLASTVHFLADGAIVVDAAGPGACDRVRERPQVTLLSPPTEPGGHSLIIDGDALVEDDKLVVRPTWAVLHRPA